MEPGFAGRTEGQQESKHALDSGTLRSVCFDLMGRPPFLSERDAWLGEDLDTFVNQCLGSQEFWVSWVEEQLYFFLLIDNFRPRSERVLELPQELLGGRIAVRDALQTIALSASFDRRNPGPDTFVTVVMEQFLGVEVQRKVRTLENGKRMYDGHACSFLGSPGRSQSDVIRIALGDKRMLPMLIGREYRRIMRRVPPKRELSAWVRSLAKGEARFIDLVASWLASAAYRERLDNRVQMSNRIFIQALYVDLSDERPDPSEARRMRNALDGLSSAGPLRSVIARLYIDSGRAKIAKPGAIADPTAWVEALFQRLLSRQPSPEELSTFVESYHNPASTPATLVYALVSHPEYQVW